MERWRPRICPCPNGPWDAERGLSRRRHAQPVLPPHVAMAPCVRAQPRSQPRHRSTAVRNPTQRRASTPSWNSPARPRWAGRGGVGRRLSSPRSIPSLPLRHLPAAPLRYFPPPLPPTVGQVHLTPWRGRWARGGGVPVCPLSLPSPHFLSELAVYCHYLAFWVRVGIILHKEAGCPLLEKYRAFFRIRGLKDTNI